MGWGEEMGERETVASCVTLPPLPNSIRGSLAEAIKGREGGERFI